MSAVIERVLVAESCLVPKDEWARICPTCGGRWHDAKSFNRHLSSVKRGRSRA